MSQPEDCVCDNGYVRDDDLKCIPVNECNVTCLLADGTPAPEGPFHLNGDECVTYECILGTVVETSSLEDYQATYCQFTQEICAALPGFGAYVEPKEGQCCGRCTEVPQPGKECKVTVETLSLTANDEDGNICVTPEPIQFSYCGGTCPSLYKGEIQINGQTGLHEVVDCKCCSGDGHYEAVAFKCGPYTREFEVKQMDNCACNICVNAMICCAAR